MSISEVVGIICLQNLLFDPKYYHLFSNSNPLNENQYIPSQNPFSNKFTVSLLEPEELIPFLKVYFVSGNLNLPEKSMINFLASLCFLQNGQCEALFVDLKYVRR
jgi:hypothetical protein